MSTDDTLALPRARRLRFRRFTLRVLWLFAAAHLYVGWRLLPDLPLALPWQVLGALTLVASTLLIPFGTMARLFLGDEAAVDRLVWAGSLAMGWFSSLLILTLIRDLALIVPALQPWTADSAMLAVVLAVVVTAIGFLNARRVAKVVPVDIMLPNLAPELDGFTIVQISDIHVGATIKGDYVDGIVRRVNALHPDLVAITGDVVDGTVERLGDETRPLGDLRARHGAYLVTGNHEYYSGADAWVDEFARLGLVPLLNQHVVIDHGGAQLVVAGVNDFSAARVHHDHVSDPGAAAKGSPEGVLKVLLAHQPRSAAAAAAAGFDLQLSGHTHGGQFWPWNHFVRMQQPYTAGLYRHGDLQVYTSRGTGYWGPPKRFGAPSEITRITLRRG